MTWLALWTGLVRVCLILGVLGVLWLIGCVAMGLAQLLEADQDRLETDESRTERRIRRIK